MDGVFMKVWLKKWMFLTVLVAVFYTGAFLADKDRLQEDLLRSPIFADIGLDSDQTSILPILDAATASLQQAIADAVDISHAKEYIQKYFPQIKVAAVAAIEETGGNEQENWWRVLLPSLDCRVTSPEPEEVPTEEASDERPPADEPQGGYRIRFFILEMLERIENLFFDD